MAANRFSNFSFQFVSFVAPFNNDYCYLIFVTRFPVCLLFFFLLLSRKCALTLNDLGSKQRSTRFPQDIQTYGEQEKVTQTIIIHKHIKVKCPSIFILILLFNLSWVNVCAVCEKLNYSCAQWQTRRRFDGRAKKFRCRLLLNSFAVITFWDFSLS